MSTAPQETGTGRRAIVASRIRGLMGEQRRTGTELGRAIGVASSSFSRRCTGEIEFGMTEVEVLAEIFGVAEAYLYGFTDARHPEPRPAALSIFDPPATPTGREVLTDRGVVDLGAYRARRRPMGRLPHPATPRPSRPAQRPLWPVKSLALHPGQVSA